MNDPKLIASEPTPGQQITELHCWIATYRDGSEGIIAGGIQGFGMTTLMSSKRYVAEALEQTARQSQSLSLDTRNPVVSVRLATFTITEGTR